MVDNKETTSPEDSFPEGQNNSSTDGEGTGSEVVNEATGQAVEKPFYEKVNEATGQNYQNDEDALAGIKETKNFVGQAEGANKLIKDVMQEHSVSREEAIQLIESRIQPSMEDNEQQQATGQEEEQKIDPNKFVSREEFEDERFYGDHPDLRPYKETIDAFRLKPQNQGKSTSDLINPESDGRDQQLIDVLSKTQAHDKAEGDKSVLHSSSQLGASKDKLQQAAEQQNAGNEQGARQAATEAVIEAFDLGK